jgi:predicted RND superfamily exporter protein
LFAVAIYGVTTIIVNDNPTRWFKSDHPIRIAEAELKGPLAGTYMSYLKFDASGTESALVRTPEVMTYMESLQERLLKHENVGGVTGVTDIIKKVRFELHGADSAFYKLPDSESEIAQELFIYEISGGDPEDLYKFITPDASAALLWLQLKEGDNQAVAAVVGVVEAFVEENKPPSGLEFSWAGLSYINIIWQNKMVSGMANALIGSGIVVGLMMIFLLRSVLLGLLSLVPLTLTISLVYGGVGFWGKAYDMPIAVLSALALGLSVDFAIHFLKRGQEIARSGAGIGATLSELFGEPSRAITRNIIVIALGFTPLLFSSLTPYITVGSFFLAIMFVSGVATLIILPALLKIRGEKAFLSWGSKDKD